MKKQGYGRKQEKSHGFLCISPIVDGDAVCHLQAGYGKIYRQPSQSRRYDEWERLCFMLKLKGITKNYLSGDSMVQALKGIDVAFRKNEFVAVLGPSGCGKTTLLNIIGGLDRYTEGDLMIRGISTKKYSDRDWDDYRNHTIGFVFQTYNLIPHQTVLANVELALTLSGVSKAERRERAKAMLQKVGLVL